MKNILNTFLLLLSTAVAVAQIPKRTSAKTKAAVKSTGTIVIFSDQKWKANGTKGLYGLR